MERKRYIGDGVYVEFDGQGLVLTTENGIEVLDRITLEWETYNRLISFVDELIKERNGSNVP